MHVYLKNNFKPEKSLANANDFSGFIYRTLLY